MHHSNGEVSDRESSVRRYSNLDYPTAPVPTPLYNKDTDLGLPHCADPPRTASQPVSDQIPESRANCTEARHRSYACTLAGNPRQISRGLEEVVVGHYNTN